MGNPSWMISRAARRWAIFRVVQGHEAADVHQRVLLGAHGAAVGMAEELAGDLLDAAILLAGLAPLDEPGVLGEARAVEVQRHAVLGSTAAPP